MGFIRGGLFVIVSVLFFISLLILNSISVISLSLDYDNVKQELVPVVKETITDTINLASVIENQRYPLMQFFCKNSSQELEYVFSEQDYTFAVPCSVISQGTEAIINYAIDNFVYSTYYKEYECKFWDCFKSSTLPLFLISQHSKDYWQGKFYSSLLVVLVLLALMFLLIEKKTNLPLVAGSLVILSSLLFAKLELFSKWLINTFINLPSIYSFSPDDFFRFFTLIFIQSSKIFWIMLIIGALLLILGILLKFFAIGFKINAFFSKFASKEKKKTEEKQDKKKSKEKILKNKK